jgi:hypothetical protein
MSEQMKKWATEDLVSLRVEREERMEAMQAAGRWEEASEYHEAMIAPLNKILMKRKVW